MIPCKHAQYAPTTPVALTRPLPPFQSLDLPGVADRMHVGRQMLDEGVALRWCKGGDQLTCCSFLYIRDESDDLLAGLGVMRTCMALQLQLRLFDLAVAVFHYACPFACFFQFPRVSFLLAVVACQLAKRSKAHESIHPSVSSLWPLTRSLVVVPCHLWFPFPITSSNRCSIPPVLLVETRRTYPTRTFHPVIYLLKTSCSTTILFSMQLRLVTCHGRLLYRPNGLVQEL